ncbi:NADH-quinone oxidoreductase subunit NuoH [Streptomyces radicis]|uniref:NADH-quinone oxidoreductase subunit H n=1 Tax=Streptomyces radicis TaxID=1750517 RepID=A0A3A9VWY7_9ACTN|nr:NADH-quinone oxidoreductase subunit NuoH [Streptomyces radicis]RKN05535.1 NADH-quinone oxidoreductase subunit NuoH [Streptomyces radicis]RKN17404.1 NADH-quinone oxidoreductase subunit NuoH [Streptomyces radicis]
MPLAQEPDLSMFGNDPFWLILLKAVFCFAFLLITVLICIVMERKVLGWMQLRIGPNRHGPWGMLQSLADGVKLMLKEDVVVKGADKALYILAPMLATIPALMAIAVIPFGPKDDPVSIFGTQTVLQLTDLPVALLYVLATAAIAVYGTVLAGWSSGSTYPLLGGVRATAQIISYEVAMGLSFAAVFLYSGSMSTSAIVEAQDDRWFMVLLPVSFLIYMVAMIGEAHRPPFDMPESEGDLVGGYLTEYSSIKFAFFMMSEYIHTVTVSALMVTLFLGGWRAPAPLSYWESANTGWWPMLWFTIKLVAVIFFFVWVRASLPRVRYDQFMVLGWKVLIPVALVWLMLVAAVRAMENEGYEFRDIVMWVLGGALALLLISFVVDVFRDRSEQRREEAEAQEGEAPFDPLAGGYPVPPLPGQTLPPVPRRPSRADRATASVAADTPGPSEASPEGREGDDA